MIEPNRVVGGLIGVAVGDALGVPVELEPRARRIEDPICDMRGGGTYGQPPGTWSDDASLTFCTVEALLNQYSTDVLGKMFARWLQEGFWTARGEVFDVGGTTRASILRILHGVPPEQSGSSLESENGNGSLMRIMPIVLANCRWSIPLMLERVHEASRVTHAHPRSQMACGLYALVTRNLLFHRAPSAAYRYAMEGARNLYLQEPWRDERRNFGRLLRGTLAEVPEREIGSNGYVVNTLEAAMWSLLTTRNFRDCVLKAVNLGDDADTVAAVAGGLAGVAYGIEKIPPEWIDALARKDDLLDAATRFAAMASR